MIQIEVLQIVELLQNKMAGIEQDIASRVIAHAIEKHFEGGAVVQIFAGVNLETEINAGGVEGVEDGPPTICQFVEGGFDQSGGALRPG